ncbi:MAG: AraC family ligand binding domain-containing protein [Mediterraneibacter gnavus]
MNKEELIHSFIQRKRSWIVDSEKLLKEGEADSGASHIRDLLIFRSTEHNYVEVIYMCQGTTTHILNGSKVILEAGDLLFLNQNAEQEILPAGEQDIAVNFIVLPEFFDTAFSMMDMEEENALKEFLVGALCGKNDNTSYLYFHVAEILPIQNLVENMVWTIFYDQPNKRRCNQITMGLLLLQLLNHVDRMETGTAAFDRELTGTVF